MRRFAFFLVILISVCEIFSLEPYETASVLIENFRDEMYMQRIDDASLEQMYKDTLSVLEGLDLDERELLYRKSQAAYYMARGYLALDTMVEVLENDKDFRNGNFKVTQKRYKNLEEIIQLLEESMLFSEQYLTMGRDARGIRQHAESLSQLVTLKTISYLIANGPKVQSLAREAIELDPNEIGAHMLIASRYIYSPPIFGGNPAKGIDIIEAIAQIDASDREDAHNINMALGVANLKLDRWWEAANYFRKAQEIYPGNVYSASLLLLCESKSE